LIVEENARVREHLSRMADTLGWRVDVAASAAQAIAMTRERSGAGDAYQLILVDAQVSGMDGRELCRKLRALEAGDVTRPVLLLMLQAYALGRQAETKHDQASDVNAILVKPFTVSMLAEAVDAKPVTKSEAKAMVRAATSASRRDRLAGIRVLLMEDNAINQQIAHKLLEDEGAYVTVVDNGALGVAAVASAPAQFDVVLMDLQMPVMDGFAATRHIRQELGLTSLPIIAITANVMASDREACLAAGMNDHVGKPFDLSNLVAVLQRHTRTVGGTAPSKGGESAPRRVLARLPAALLADAQAMGIELQEALARLGGNLGVYRRMLHSFVDGLSTKHDELADLLKKGKRQEAGRLMHTLKGLASTLGMQALSSVSAQAEHKLAGPASRGQHHEMLLDLKLRIEAAVRDAAHIARSLDALLQAGGTEATPADPLPNPATTSLKDSMDELMTLLRSADMRAVDVYEQMRSQHAQSFAEFFVALDKAMTDLDFDRAHADCMAMMKGVSV
jgi:CheY-like chemotaxis protein